MDNESLKLGLVNIFAGVLIIAVCLPLLKDKIGMNHWYGIRFKKSFESKENWYKINRYGAQRLILWSVLIVAIGILTLFVPVSNNKILLIVLPYTPAILIIPAIESWLYARKL